MRPGAAAFKYKDLSSLPRRSPAYNWDEGGPPGLPRRSPLADEDGLLSLPACQLIYSALMYLKARSAAPQGHSAAAR